MIRKDAFMALIFAIVQQRGTLIPIIFFSVVQIDYEEKVNLFEIKKSK